MCKEKLSNLDVMEIQKYQQNRFPVLLVDFITEAVPGKYAKGYKNFTYNEWYFPAHFEDEPNVPGFVQIEALAQVFLMTFLTFSEHRGKKTAFVKVKDATFRRKIIPGDTLETEAVLESFRRGVAKGYAKSTVKGEEACSAKFIIALPDVVKSMAPKVKL